MIKLAGHVPVLLEEAIEYLEVRHNGIYVDMTTGGGGHSKRILEKLDGTGHLFCFDQDEFALGEAKKNLARYANVAFINDNFVNCRKQLSSLGIEKVDGILYDLGVSSYQFDMPDRGFSYRQEGPLDMRMDKTNPITASIIVNTYPEKELGNIFYRYGEDPFARPIARKIVEYRMKKTIETTSELVDIIKSALPQAILHKKGHPAKQVFQALRIVVNDELGVLEKSLFDSVDILKPGGRIVVITFHSLEDRICKDMFKRLSTIDIPKGLPVIPDEKPVLKLVTRHVVKPSDDEINDNNRAHSAKLRAVEKTL